MKNINTKKVIAGAAALAVGASFLGAAVAAQVDFGSPVVKGDVIGTNGMPTATIIVGNESQAADSIWAGNIAAAIASKAYTTETHTYEIPGTEGTEGTTTTIDDGKIFDKFDIGAGREEVTLKAADYTLLGDYDVKVDDDEFGDDEISVKESLVVGANIAFDDDEDVSALTATIPKKDIVYTVDFSPAIIDDASDDGSPDMKFNIMGKQYTLESWDGSELVLIQNKATTPYGEGDSFTVGDYTIEVTNILDNGTNTADEYQYEAELTLKDASGNVVAAEVYTTGDDDIFNDYLDIDVEIDKVYATRITVVAGTSAKLTLKNNTIIKDFPNKGDELWRAYFTPGTVSQSLKKIEIKNDHADLDFKDEDALKIGDEIVLPNGFAKIEFTGLTNETKTKFSIEDGIVSYVDDGEEDHSLFIYNYDTGTDITTWTTDDEIDGHQLYIEIDGTDGEADGHTYTAAVTIQLDDDEGDYLQSNGTWDADPETWYIDADSLSTTVDSNKTTDQDGWLPLTFNSPITDDETFYYGLFVTESSDNVTNIAVGLRSDKGDDNTAANYKIYDGATWVLNGVTYDVTTTFNDDATYAGTKTDTATILTDDLESVLEFTINDGQETKVYVDPYTGDIVDDEIDSSYEATSVAVDGVDADLGTDADDSTEAYTRYGSYYYIDGGMFGMDIPEDQLYAVITIGNGTTTTGGSEGTDATTGSYTTTVPANVDPINLVKSDLASVAGTKIIVGGHLANKLAVGVTNDYLTQAGQWVMGKDTTTGNIVVAGFTADDTGAATRAFITAIQ